MWTPQWHDENAYVLQARMLSEGHLWMTPHPLAEFFNTFHVLTTPVYSGKYYPGTAAFYVPGMWLGLPPVATALAMSIAMMWMWSDVLIRLRAPLAPLLLLAMGMSSASFQGITLRVMSQGALMFLVGVVWWITADFIRVRRHSRRVTAIDLPRLLLCGFLAGWCLLIRPIDAVILLAVPAWCVLRSLKSLSTFASFQRIMLGLLTVSPAIFLMLLINRGITGSVFTTPWSLYASMYQPGEQLGFPVFEPGLLAADAPLQKHLFYEGFMTLLKAHTPFEVLWSWLGGFRLDLLLRMCAAVLPLALLLPLAIVGGVTRRGRLFLLPILGVLFLYSCYAWMSGHYFVVVAPLVAMCIAIGLQRVQERIGLFKGPWASGVLLTWVALSVLATSEPNAPVQLYRTSPMPTLAHFERIVSPQIKRPALVFFTFGRSSVVNEELVYNLENADIDQCELIRAVDISGKRSALIDYYRALGRDRQIYAYDTGSGVFQNLGTTRDVSSSP